MASSFSIGHREASSYYGERPDLFCVCCKAREAVGYIPKCWLCFVGCLETIAKVFPASFQFFAATTWVPEGPPRATERWA